MARIVKADPLSLGNDIELEFDVIEVNADYSGCGSHLLHLKVQMGRDEANKLYKKLDAMAEEVEDEQAE